MIPATGASKRGLLGSCVAVATAACVIGLAATPESVSTSQLQLAAAQAIIVGSSTNPSGAGVADFYQGKVIPPGATIVVIPFDQAPGGIEDALLANPTGPNVVIASGWGASKASEVLRGSAATDPAITGATWYLDNSLNTPNGGFATRYPLFSRLIGIDPTPTPTDVAETWQVSYEYDVNGQAPFIPTNLLAVANSFVAYFYNHDAQVNLDLDNLPDGSIVTKVDKTTYIMVPSERLPLARLIAEFGPIGQIVADGLEPLLTVLVNSAYPNNDPLHNPNQNIRAQLLPPPGQLAAAAAQVPGALVQGATAVVNDITNLPGTLSVPATPPTPVSTLAVQRQNPAGLAPPDPPQLPKPEVVATLEPNDSSNITKPTLTDDGKKVSPGTTTGTTQQQNGWKPGDGIKAVLGGLQQFLSGGTASTTAGTPAAGTGSDTAASTSSATNAGTP